MTNQIKKGESKSAVSSNNEIEGGNLTGNENIPASGPSDNADCLYPNDEELCKQLAEFVDEIPYEVSEKDECRICHEGGEEEPLVSPCWCKGSVGLMHLSCLEHWIETSHTAYCEICGYYFHLEVRRRYPLCSSIWIWLKYIANKRQLSSDCMVFVVVTPLLLASLFLAVWVYLHYRHMSGENEVMARLGTVGLVLLVLAVATIYVVWLCTTMKYHCRGWMAWWLNCYTIRVVMDDVIIPRPLDRTFR